MLRAGHLSCKLTAQGAILNGEIVAEYKVKKEQLPVFKEVLKNGK